MPVLVSLELRERELPTRTLAKLRLVGAVESERVPLVEVPVPETATWTVEVERRNRVKVMFPESEAAAVGLNTTLNETL